MGISRDNDVNQPRTRVERVSDCDLVVSRAFDAPARLMWEAWTRAELFRKWWVPESFRLNLRACEMDVRVGGRYRLVFLHEGSTMEFFGTYLEVVPHSRLVWTNEEGGGQTVTTVTFEETAGRTRLVVRNRYPSKEALEADGSTDALPDSLDQLATLLAGLVSGTVTR
ncbi:MAG: SRPBCC domain-containing protein [Phycisphaerae bacterium]|jgi:uncharacterized protein YndB with AHSA1/START domain|nr:SRPBCC domain-containing protein [Phycisphaerae bacterium]MCZ2400390.1 SRPBCC domain-containing protein [Phycisphaerae bacterium]